MSQLVTVESIVDKVRLAADQQGSTLRTSDADIIMLISDAYGRYVGQGSGAGWPYWLSLYESTLPIGRSTSGTSDYPFGLIEFQSGTDRVEGVYRFELRMPNGFWHELEPVAFQRANQLQWGGADATGVPQQYWVHGGSGDNINGNLQTLGFSPPSDAAYDCRVWYAPIAEIDSLVDELDIGPVGGEWWIVWDVVGTLAIRDHYPEQAQMAAAQQGKVWAELVKRVNGRNKNASFRVQDTRGQRRLRGFLRTVLP